MKNNLRKEIAGKHFYLISVIVLLILTPLLTLLFFRIKKYRDLVNYYEQLVKEEPNKEEEQSIKKYDNSNNFKISSCECQGRIQNNYSNPQGRKI